MHKPDSVFNAAYNVLSEKSSFKLQLKKISSGYYSSTHGDMTITVSDSSKVVGGKSQWQIVIMNGNEIELSEFGKSRDDCYAIGVKHLMKR